MRMRTIDQVAEYVRAIDPDTALTKTAIRGNPQFKSREKVSAGFGQAGGIFV